MGIIVPKPSTGTLAQDLPKVDNSLSVRNRQPITPIQKNIENPAKLPNGSALEEQTNTAGDTFKHSVKMAEANAGNIVIYKPGIINGNKKTTKTQGSDSDNLPEVKDGKKKTVVSQNANSQPAAAPAKQTGTNPSGAASSQPQLNPANDNVVVSQAAEVYYAEKTEDTEEDDDKNVTSSSKAEETAESDKTSGKTTNPIKYTQDNKGSLLTLAKLNSLAATSGYTAVTADPLHPVKVDSLICKMQAGNATGSLPTQPKTENDIKLDEIRHVTYTIEKGYKLGDVVTSYSTNVQRDAYKLRTLASHSGYNWCKAPAWQNIKAEPEDINFKTDYDFSDVEKSVKDDDDFESNTSLLSVIGSGLRNLFGGNNEEEEFLV